MPHDCHNALAVTGGGCDRHRLRHARHHRGGHGGPKALPADITIEHPSGRIAVRLEPDNRQTVPVASIQRTARKLFEGAVFAAARRTCRSELPLAS